MSTNIYQKKKTTKKNTSTFIIQKYEIPGFHNEDLDHGLQDMAVYVL
jgi:hypothetical protein